MSHYPVSSAFLFHIHPLQDELFLVCSHMEEPIDIVRGALIHARHLGELLFARFFHFIKRAEGMPEGVPAVWADAFDVVKDGLRISFVRPFPVIGDDEAVGFIAYELEKLESRLMVIENDRVVGEERLLTDLGARVRDVAVSPDGAVWAITDEEDGKLVRLAATP